MIVDRIEDMLRGTYKPSEEALDREESMAEQWGNHQLDLFSRNFLERGGDDGHRPKVSGSSPFWCTKRLTYKIVGAEEEEVAPRTLNAWYLGRVVENMIVRQIMLASPYPVVWPQLTEDGELREYEGTRHVGGTELHGHIDIVIDHPDYGLVPVEVKSHADYGYRMVKTKREIPQTFGHHGQLQWYMTAMNAKKGVYVAVSKSTGHCTELWTDPDTALMQEYDDSYVAAKAAAAASLEVLRPDWAQTKAGLHRKTKEDKGRRMEKVSDVRCGYCPFTKVCWPDFHREVNEKGQPVWVKELPV